MTYNYRDLINVAGDIADNTAGSQKVVPNRVLQYDADFACYEVVDLDKPVTSDFKKLLSKIDFLRRLVGAESVNAHITMGEKSGREGVATVKAYQDQREDSPIKVRVRELRLMLANLGVHKDFPTMHAVPSFFREADDTICTMQGEQILEHGFSSSVIISGDKDLWMIAGNHYCMKTEKLWSNRGYGSTKFREVGNVKPKLIGRGTSWFWHQMIMGDTVDNIPGLERIDNRSLDLWTPLKKGSRKAGSGLCGEGKAVAVLEDCCSDTEAFRRVSQLYREYYKMGWQDRFVEQAYLLWMQRTRNPCDVLDFIASVGMTVTFNKQQSMALAAYKARWKLSGALN